MSTIDVSGTYTIMDIINQYTSLDGKGSYLYAAEVMARKCPFVQDMPMFPSNQIFQHIDARRTVLSSPGTRRFNEGVAPSITKTEPFTEGIAMVEDWSEVDYALWQIQNDPNAWRQGEDKAKIESLTQKMENLILYGSLATDPAAFNGLTTRFNLSTRRPNGDTTWPYNCVLAGGSSSVSSIWVIEWGQNKVFGVYPKNLPAGLKIEDKGQVTVNTNTEAAPKYMDALRTHFCWYMGLVVKDERCVQRIANVELVLASNAFDPELLVDAINNLPGGGDAGNTVIYVNRTHKGQADKSALNKLNTYFTQDASGDVWGRRVTRFQGIPVRMAEKIVAETAAT
jgi:hypothetical protein